MASIAHEYGLPVLITVTAGLLLGIIGWVAKTVVHRVTQWLRQLDQNDRTMLDNQNKMQQSIAAIRRIGHVQHVQNKEAIENMTNQLTVHRHRVEGVVKDIADLSKEIKDHLPEEKDDKHPN